MQVIALLAIVAVAAAASPSWEEFKATYNKKYASDTEEYFRSHIYNTNVEFIENHNAGRHSYTLAVNEFADLLHSEFRKLYLAPKFDVNTIARNNSLYKAPVGALPTSVDWRQKGVVTPIKNQGQCGSCWSFSTTGSVEGAHAIKTGSLVSLSEQNLMDCSTAEGNQGCNGGLMDQAFEYIIKNNGIDTESSYPYQAVQGKCKYNAANSGATISSYTDVTKDSESDLQTASANIGPISVAIDAGLNSFQFYSGGVYNPAGCSSTQLDHGVLVVGYGVDGSQDYWLVKNSWGTSWGLQGYIMMARNANNKCGIASMASYPVV